MAIVEVCVPAKREDVFAVLADGWTYSDWVVGTTHIRAVDAGWPSPGTELHHSVGPWPLSLKDRTVSVRCEPPSLLVLAPQLWPLGAATVTITLEEPEPGQTLIGIHEAIERGPMRWLRTRIDDLLLHYRNLESLRRLADLAVRGTRPARGALARDDAPPSVVRRHVG